MNNFVQRIFTGIILVLVITVAVIWNFYSLIFLILTINLLSLLEFYRLFNFDNIMPLKLPGVTLSVSMIVTVALVISGKSYWGIILINIPATFFIFILELYRKKINPFHNLAFTLLGIICIAIPLCFFICIAFLPFKAGIYNYRFILGYFLMLWANDAGAYFIGRTFGKHALFKRISPRKTWEGSAGGIVCALFAAYIISHYIKFLNTMEWLSLPVLIAVIGTFGDLVKSMMKRSLHLKDSGTILPGHGGMLDRFDTLLSSAPFVFCYMILFGHGN